MAIGSELNSGYWITQPKPLDTKTYFENLDEACGPETSPEDLRIAGHLSPGLRAKGLKFVVRDNGNGEPAEYWFIDDYQEPKTEYLSEPPWMITTPAFIPQPVLYQPEIPEFDLTAHNADENAHGPIRQKIQEVAGDTHFASNAPGFKYTNPDGSKMTINQYGDRQPEAWTGSYKKFNDEILKNIEKGVSSFDGTYYVK